MLSASKTSIVGLLLTVSLGSAWAQTVQEVIDLDREIAVAKRRTELEKLKAEDPSAQRSSRPLIAPEVKPPTEEQFSVRAIYGPVTALRALVAYRDTVPVEMSMSGEAAREIAGWRLTSLNTTQLVLERRVLAPPARPAQGGKGRAEPEFVVERVVVPVRMQSLQAQVAPVLPSSNPAALAPAPLPASVLPMIAAPGAAVVPPSKK